MLPRMIVVAISVLLGVGCGRSDQVTIPRNESPVGNKTARTKVAPSTNAIHSGGLGSRASRTNPSRREPRAHPKFAKTNPDANRLASRVDDAAASDFDGTFSEETDNTVASADHAAAAIQDDAPAALKRAGQARANVAEREVRFGGIRMNAPKAWTRERPPIKLIVAAFTIPGGSGESSDAQLTVSLAVRNNRNGLTRLREQIEQEKQSKESKVEELTIGDYEVVLVDSSGRYDDGDDLASPTRPGRYRALNAMVFLGDSVYFVNCSGPEQTVSKRLGEFYEFLESMKAVK